MLLKSFVRSLEFARAILGWHPYQVRNQLSIVDEMLLFSIVLAAQAGAGGVIEGFDEAVSFLPYRFPRSVSTARSCLQV